MIKLHKKESYTELPYSFLLTELRWKLNLAFDNLIYFLLRTWRCTIERILFRLLIYIHLNHQYNIQLGIEFYEIR